jgi:hypothetical protein
VNVIHDEISRITESGLVTAKDQELEFDIIVCATGFHVAYVPRLYEHPITSIKCIAALLTFRQYHRRYGRNRHARGLVPRTKYLLQHSCSQISQLLCRQWTNGKLGTRLRLTKRESSVNVTR